ncbi:RAMP superfamily CRISPR-associated protein [Crocosphaera sp. XPORK-15E]|uniref:RAMP superfamily CRISPR-associated protein n=1 Tax=Crocosphaera sp. XPORK-15E TaxID=3110247 RepID=UPI002B1F0519|nr:RAMP superfamily CRISPR-associated protein [Crocosphaera sp. XPORK-15E]MEA5537045.1 RAMP superfamily CRISPR-associated protein [Crocosphaera sp. XPORK-15E]
MYQKAYGIIETLAPLHVGASANEENGNLNLIFRDQFTQTGIIPGSSLRGRFRADLRGESKDHGHWYGQEAIPGEPDSTSEGLVKFEYASIVWIPVFCPNQPIVRVSSPSLLKRYQKLTQPQTRQVEYIEPYSYCGKKSSDILFFNLGFLPLKKEEEKLKNFIPSEVRESESYLLLVVDDNEISMIHDMALYRQSRVSLEPNQKKAKKGAFFDVEALPEGTVLIFPLALRKTFEQKPIQWENFIKAHEIKSGKELYFGGLESIGFGRTEVHLKSCLSGSTKPVV